MHTPGPGAVVSLVLLTSLVISGCDRRIEPLDPDEKPRRPDLSRIFRPEEDPFAEVTGGGGGGPAQPGRAGPRAPAASAEKPISGTIRLAPELADQVPAGAVLFLIARGGAAGPPLAVVKVDAPSFPFDFEIGADDRMIEAIPFQGPLRLSARLDGDGNASSRTPGDLQGSAPDVALPGATGVVVTIDERI